VRFVGAIKDVADNMRMHGMEYLKMEKCMFSKYPSENTGCNSSGTLPVTSGTATLTFTDQSITSHCRVIRRKGTFCSKSPVNVIIDTFCRIVNHKIQDVGLLLKLQY
jgi:hypothetical protein